jgi:carboxymethylenebutenolidase
MVPVEGGDSVRVWVVYPERSTNAPVVVVVHEIFGLSTWVRGVADQLAADGFIAIAPDYLTGKTTLPADSLTMDAGRALIRGLDPLEVVRRTTAAAEYGMSRPAALRRYGVVGFCWGGGVVFEHASRSPNLGAGVAYYGAPGEATPLADVRAPLLGLYGENDARVNASIARVDSTLRAAGRSFDHQIFAGAGHGFLRQQGGAAGANLAASRAAWPRTVSFFRTHLGQ